MATAGCYAAVLLLLEDSSAAAADASRAAVVLLQQQQQSAMMAVVAAKESKNRRSESRAPILFRQFSLSLSFLVIADHQREKKSFSSVSVAPLSQVDVLIVRYIECGRIGHISSH